MTEEFSDSAIDALIAASLRRAYSDDPATDAEIQEAITDASTAADDATRLERIRSLLKTPAPRPATPDRLGRLMAMNRKNEDDQFSEPTQRGIEDARRKALEDLLKDAPAEEGGGQADDHP